MAAPDFWYEIGSTYSYPAAMRIERLADAAHVELRWRPFLLGPIFKAYGWNDSPFNIYAAKGRYMWRDLQRICDAEGLPLKLPPVLFPQNGGLHWSVSARAGFLPSAAPVCRELCRAEGHQRRRDASHDSGRA
jgi:2-hydroxychromene-2-carboxylate isomerase